MIRPAKQIRRKDLKRQKKQAQVSAQFMLNAVLWKIIQENMPEPEEGVEPTGIGVLTVDLEEFKEVPTNIKLQVTYDNDAGNLIITAGLEEPKSIIIQPGKEVIENVG